MKHLLIDYGTLAFAFARPLPLVFDFASQGVMTTQRWHNKRLTWCNMHINQHYQHPACILQIIQDDPRFFNSIQFHTKLNRSTTSLLALARPFGFGFLSMAALLFSNLRNPRGMCTIPRSPSTVFHKHDRRMTCWMHMVLLWFCYVFQ